MYRARVITFCAGAVLCLVLGACTADWLNAAARLVPVKPEDRAGVVALRYMAGGYHGPIGSTLDDQVVVYHFTYQNGVTLWALVLLHAHTGDPDYATQVGASLRKYEADGLYYPGGDDPIDYLGAMAHATLAYVIETGDTQFLDEALDSAAYFHERVARTPEGLIAYHADPERGRIWADALFMVAPLLAKAGTVLGDTSYYDDVLAQFRGFEERLRDPAVGLYHQGYNWHGSGATPGFWGRANGWVAVAMTEVLDTIPPEYPGRDELLSSYQEFMAAVAAHQGPGGMWHQLLDRWDSYEESSCTGLLLYALGRGVQRGWLDAGYGDVVARGEAGLGRMIALNGDIYNVCPGTGPQASEQDYLSRGPTRNDSHGTGPVLLGLYAGMVAAQTEE